MAGFFQFLLQPTFPLLFAQEGVQVAGLEQRNMAVRNIRYNDSFSKINICFITFFLEYCDQN